ncbi:hypothetical protein XENOCAPTIV_017392 [Xenoophorus captivus]|uniref:SWIM-type domain-containing protein n=1 Tax=Xenoophorus captivus TaxID=1517983 RepID=A0ABV0QSB9_9TELE
MDRSHLNRHELKRYEKIAVIGCDPYKVRGCWVVVREDGTVIMAHCICKAGLGEACSHAAALMYALLAAVNVKDGQSSTQKACAWVIPGKTSQIQYEELSKISMTKKNKSKSTTLPSIPVPSEDEYMRFFQQLHECDVQEGNPNGKCILDGEI